MMKKISLGEYESLRPIGRGGKKSEQRKYIEAMEPGTAIRLSHEGIRHFSNSDCAFSSTLSNVNVKLGAKLGLHYSFVHDGEDFLLVKCCRL